MLKIQFDNQAELDAYIKKQTERKIKGYLTHSERDQLERLIKNPKEYIKETKEESKSKPPLVMNIAELRKPCAEVTKEDNVKEIIKKLKETYTHYNAIGISANQIGINKKISYIKIPKFIGKDGKWNYNEFIIINGKVIEKDRPTKIMNEICLSFPGVPVTTKRYVFITVEYLNENLEHKTTTFQDLESFAIQHECDHQNGLTIFDRKWRA